MNPLPRLSFPEYNFRVAQKEGKLFIYDECRRKWVTLTPEEWVRQHLLAFLAQEKKFPQGLLSVETSVKYGSMQKRCDILAYDRNGKPFLIAECKAASVPLGNDTFQQAARYNLNFHVPWLVISNGLQTVCCRLDFEKQSWEVLAEIPEFPSE